MDILTPPTRLTTKAIALSCDPTSTPVQAYSPLSYLLELADRASSRAPPSNRNDHS